MHSSNKITDVNFLLDSFPSFDWTPTQKNLKWPSVIQQIFLSSIRPILLHLPSFPLPFPAIPWQTRDLHYPCLLHRMPSCNPPPPPIISSSINAVVSLATSTTGGA
jgi:hypothetical protein